MKKKLLIAVGDCVHSREAAKYAVAITQAQKNVHYTFFNIPAAVPSILMKEMDGAQECKEEIEALIRKSSEASICVLETLKENFLKSGVSEDRISVLSKPMESGMAKDVLRQAEEKEYDGIVLGSKGLTPSRDVLVGTTATKVVEHSLKTPVWVVEECAESKDILITVDGSESSLHVLDHVICMAGANPDFRFVLFHVRPFLSHYYSLDFERKNPKLQKLMQNKDIARMERFNQQAFQKFDNAGIPKSQVYTKVNEHGYDISTAILEESRRGAYGTVVIGRRGEREAFFTGRIAMRLMQKMPSPALWIVP